MSYTDQRTSLPGLSLWRHRAFMLLWSGQSVSELGSAVTVIALPLVAIVALRASVAQVALLSASGRLPFLVFALPAGVIVDRISPRAVMTASNVGRMILIIWVPVGRYLGVLTFAQLFAVGFGMGTGTVFFDIAYQSFVPAILPRSALVDANGKLSASSSFASIAGPSLCAGLVSALGAAQAMIADALSYVVSVVSLVSIKTANPTSAREGGLQRERRPIRSLRDLQRTVNAGLRFAFSDAIMKKIVICTCMANLFFAMAISLQIVYLVRVLSVPPAATGALSALSGVGGLIGGLTAKQLSRWLGSARVIYLAPLCLGALGFLIPLAAPGWRLALFICGWFGLSFCVVIYNVSQLSYRQALCPPDLIGRLNAALRWLAWGLSPIGALAGGAVGSAAGIRQGLWIAVAGIWASGFWVLFSPLRGHRDVPIMDGSVPGGNSRR